MSAKLGIQETKEAIIATAKFYKLGKEVMADGKVNLKDLPAIISAGPGIFSSATIGLEGAEKIPSEIKDLSTDEALEIAEAIKAEFSVGDEKAMAIIAKSLKLIASGLELASEF